MTDEAYCIGSTIVTSWAQIVASLRLTGGSYGHNISLSEDDVLTSCFMFVRFCIGSLELELTPALPTLHRCHRRSHTNAFTMGASLNGGGGDGGSSSSSQSWQKSVVSASAALLIALSPLNAVAAETARAANTELSPVEMLVEKTTAAQVCVVPVCLGSPLLGFVSIVMDNSSPTVERDQQTALISVTRIIMDPTNATPRRNKYFS